MRPDQTDLDADGGTEPNSPATEHRVSRRQLLAVGAGAALSAVGLGVSRALTKSHGPGVIEFGHEAAAPPASYLTRPDLRIPSLTVSRTSNAVAPGLLLLAPYNAPSPAQAGALIVDNSGHAVWEQPLANLVTSDFRVQTLHGAPVLTWWQGIIRYGHGIGSYVIADTSYKPIARVNAGNGHQGDLHEFILTDRGTALLTSYAITAADVRAVGGPSRGTIQDAIVQEVDIATGKVLLEWHSLDHIPITESYWLPYGADWDYVHINSIDVDQDQNLLVSARNTHTIYKLDRRTGQIMWRLGGKHSNFALPTAAQFMWQHDARRQPNGTITVFDNGSKVSRAIVLAVDERHRDADLVREYTHPGNLFADSQGNVQVLPNGNVLVGWGAQPYVSEFTASGDLIFDSQLAQNYISYRAYRVPWAGQGPGLPAVVARRAGSRTDVHVSWNGDTRVQRWSVLAGASGTTVAATALRSGFETVIAVARSLTQLRVQAADAHGRTLATSAVVNV